MQPDSIADREMRIDYAPSSIGDQGHFSRADGQFKVYNRWDPVQPDFLGLGATLGSFCASPLSASEWCPLLLAVRQPNRDSTKLRVLRL